MSAYARMDNDEFETAAGGARYENSGDHYIPPPRMTKPMDQTPINDVHMSAMYSERDQYAHHSLFYLLSRRVANNVIDSPVAFVNERYHNSAVDELANVVI